MGFRELLWGGKKVGKITDTEGYARVVREIGNRGDQDGMTGVPNAHPAGEAEVAVAEAVSNSNYEF